MNAAKRICLSPRRFESTTIEILSVGFCSLDDYCIKNIFDWLSIEDLCRFKMTCKRFYLLANEHFQKTYVQIWAINSIYIIALILIT